jgi:hypothetical protein
MYVAYIPMYMLQRAVCEHEKGVSLKIEIGNPERTDQ